MNKSESSIFDIDYISLKSISYSLVESDEIAIREHPLWYLLTVEDDCTDIFTSAILHNQYKNLYDCLPKYDLNKRNYNMIFKGVFPNANVLQIFKKG